MSDSRPVPPLLSISLPDRAAYAVIGGVAVAIQGLLFCLIYLNEPTGDPPGWVRQLPALNALFNGLSAGLVTAGVVAIRIRKPRLHVGLIAAGLAFSALFLASYILHHAYAGDTRFGGEGWIRSTYFLVLISHILFSMGVVPLLLATVFFAVTGRWPGHRKLARLTFPIWLYVSVTGVAIFWFLHAGS